MAKRRHIFFDLDHTLWDFERNASETVAELLLEFRGHIGEEIDPDHFYGIYARINRSLWDAYERQEIEMEDIRKGRWERAFGEVGVDPGVWMHDFGQDYLNRCPMKQNLMDGAFELLETLQTDFTLGIITNGLASNQYTKLERSGIRDFFADVVTVDMVGVPKPDARMFEFALTRAGAEAGAAMYVGDTYEADVLGSIRAGFSVIFFNPHSQPNPENVPEVQSLREIPQMLESAWR